MAESDQAKPTSGDAPSSSTPTTPASGQGGDPGSIRVERLIKRETVDPGAIRTESIPFSESGRVTRVVINKIDKKR